MSKIFHIITINYLSHKSSYYSKMVTYNDVFQSILDFCSSERWTGFLAASVRASTVPVHEAKLDVRTSSYYLFVIMLQFIFFFLEHLFISK
jgi:hypothetical protein